MGTPMTIEDSFTHGGQHRTLSPRANVVRYAFGKMGKAGMRELVIALLLSCAWAQQPQTQSAEALKAESIADQRCWISLKKRGVRVFNLWDSYLQDRWPTARVKN